MMMASWEDTFCINDQAITWTNINLILWHYVLWHHIDGLLQGCSNSIANALELLQSCSKPLMSHYTTMS